MLYVRSSSYSFLHFVENVKKGTMTRKGGVFKGPEKNDEKIGITVDKDLKNKSGPVGIFDEAGVLPVRFRTRV
jgi:hypothetical protein